MFNINNYIYGGVKNAYELMSSFIPDLSKSKAGFHMPGKYSKGWKKIVHRGDSYRNRTEARESARRLNQITKRQSKPITHLFFMGPMFQEINVTPRPVNSFEGWPDTTKRSRIHRTGSRPHFKKVSA